MSVLPRSPGPKESSGSDFCSLGSHKSQHALNCDFSTFPPDNFLFGVFLCSEFLFSLCFLVSKPACLNPVLPWSGAGCVWDESRWSSHVCHAGAAVLSPAVLVVVTAVLLVTLHSEPEGSFKFTCQSCSSFPWLTVPLLSVLLGRDCSSKEHCSLLLT